MTATNAAMQPTATPTDPPTLSPPAEEDEGAELLWAAAVGAMLVAGSGEGGGEGEGEGDDIGADEGRAEDEGGRIDGFGERTGRGFGATDGLPRGGEGGGSVPT